MTGVQTCALPIYLLPGYWPKRLLITNFSPLFIAGAMFYRTYVHGPSIARILTILVAWATTLVTEIRGLGSIRAHFRTEFDPAVIAVVVTVFFVALGIVALHRTGAASRWRWTTLGALTYPLYLLHQNLGFMTFNIAYGSVAPWLLLCIVVIAMLLLAYLVHTQIETRYAKRFSAALNRFADWLSGVRSVLRR